MKCQQPKPCDNEALPSTVIYRPSADSASRVCGPCLESRLAGRSVQPSRPPDSALPCQHCKMAHDPQSHCPIEVDRRRSGLRPMDCSAGIIALEEGELTEEEDILALFQALIDNGLAWSLQGYYGRAAADMIRSGQCIDTHGVLLKG